MAAVRMGEHLVIAVIGGAIALLLRAAAKYTATALAARKRRRTYLCNIPSIPGEPAAVQHGWGSAGCDRHTRREVWAYNSVQHRLDHEGKGRQFEHTLFGPYTNDFGRPGYFGVTFRLCGRGFRAGDRPLLIL